MANKTDLEKGLELRNKLLGKRASGAATALAELAPDLDEIMNEVSLVVSGPALVSNLRCAAPLPSSRSWLCNASRS